MAQEIRNVNAQRPRNCTQGLEARIKGVIIFETPDRVRGQTDLSG